MHHGYGRGLIGPPTFANHSKMYHPPKPSGIPIVPIIIGIVVIVGIIVGIYMYSKRNKSSTSSSPPVTITSSKPSTGTSTSSKPSTSTSTSQTVSTTSSSFSTGGGGGGGIAAQLSGGGGLSAPVPTDEQIIVYQQFKNQFKNTYLYVKNGNTLGLTDSLTTADKFDITNGTMRSFNTGLYVKDPNDKNVNPLMVSTGYATNITWDGTNIKVGSKYLTYNSGVKIETFDSTKPNLYNWTRET